MPKNYMVNVTNLFNSEILQGVTAFVVLVFFFREAANNLM